MKTAAGKALDATMGKTLNDSIIGVISSLGTVRFGIDADGNYGYKKIGADTVIPFKKGSVIKNYGQVSSENNFLLCPKVI